MNHQHLQVGQRVQTPQGVGYIVAQADYGYWVQLDAGNEVMALSSDVDTIRDEALTELTAWGIGLLSIGFVVGLLMGWMFG